MKASELVTVVVPTRNSSATLESCLRSVRDQANAALEVIVVDNNSTDSTLKIAQRYSDQVATFGSERSAQRNHGARLASGDYLLFVDSDMVLDPGLVADCVHTIRSSGGPAVIIPEDSFGHGFVARCRAFERS